MGTFFRCRCPPCKYIFCHIPWKKCLIASFARRLKSLQDRFHPSITFGCAFQVLLYGAENNRWLISSLAGMIVSPQWFRGAKTNDVPNTFNLNRPVSDPSVMPGTSLDAGSPTCDSVASHLMTDPLEGEPGTEDDVIDKVRPFLWPFPRR